MISNGCAGPKRLLTWLVSWQLSQVSHSPDLDETDKPASLYAATRKAGEEIPPEYI